MSRLRTISVTAALVLLPAVGCAAARTAGGLMDDVGRAADDIVRSGDELADGSVALPHVPQPVPAGRVASLGDDIEKASAALVDQHAADVSDEDAYRVIELSCTATDWLEVGAADSLAEAVEKVMVNEGGSGTLRNRVEDLSDDLAAARTSGDTVSLLASFAVCEAVDAG
jgi:hypothetical protein